MGSIPDPIEATRLRTLFAGNLVVDRAEQALRAYGDLTREVATLLLQTWRYTPELSARERAAVLARFPLDEYPHRQPLDEGNSGPGGAL